MEILLEGMGLNENIQAADGKEALNILKRKGKGSVGLIISDWSMPQMDGMEPLLACKQNPALKHIPLIMMSSRETKETEVSAPMEAGVNAYLPKPFSPEEFQEVLKVAGVRAGA